KCKVGDHQKEHQCPKDARNNTAKRQSGTAVFGGIVSSLFLCHEAGDQGRRTGQAGTKEEAGDSQHEGDDRKGLVLAAGRNAAARLILGIVHWVVLPAFILRRRRGRKFSLSDRSTRLWGRMFERVKCRRGRVRL